MASAAEIAASHHERWDGTGYPNRIKGEAIPLAGRIVAVADVFDALTTERPYKQAWTPERARAYLAENAGAHFDPRVVDAFLSRWSQVEGAISPMHSQDPCLRSGGEQEEPASLPVSSASDDERTQNPCRLGLSLAAERLAIRPSPQATIRIEALDGL